MSEADRLLLERVERAIGLTRPFLTPEEAEEHRRMLFSLARTHPKTSSWLLDQRPRKVPDKSGVVRKKDDDALLASIARRSSGGRSKG